MLRVTGLQLPLNHTEQDLRKAIVQKLAIADDDLLAFDLFKRSYDARKKNHIVFIYAVDVHLSHDLEQDLLSKFSRKNDTQVKPTPDMSYHFPVMASASFPEKNQQRPVVIGFGPCGMLAALLLAQMGLKPIVLERGKEVRQRTQDTWQLWRKGKLNPESNVQFGEGGAGTFSDGKLYSQIKDPHFIGRKVINEFIRAGAPKEILYINKPHIGTFKLVSMVEKIREQIISLGGEIRFSQKVSKLQIDKGKLSGIVLQNGEILLTRHAVLSIGHSARDTFQMLLEQGVYMEAKAFSIGFRIEHPQALIDKARFGKEAGNKMLGAADYKLVHHCKNGRSVYSFCMCPGGTVVAAASEEGGVVTNGMSQYSRNERNANAAIVVGIEPERDYPEHVLAGVELQRRLEVLAFKRGGENYCAPAQLVGDFLKNRASSQLASVQASYKPGVTLTNLSDLLPEFAIEALREALPVFDKKIKGFAMDDALLSAVETRTSSPVCIKRADTFQSVNTKGLYPAGEGAGYAGGILSAGVDGIRVAEALAIDLLSH